ncbi:hypothetical protein [Sulfurisphaera tokodaii]|uniref:Uncharacterized protein n=2 Tax=Sulfurisphaera tokodaii TaxID=111955 RepID=Q96ZT0_SULTO|nr:hypothetical protein [Sulfurisphaera tokodaii]BAB66843.1 hypothetical protein STK_17550 [Sulfurisphaera tokodaii str. 7]HII73375.1 hypothetical protein [Sulfurisphaera tokodaii]
MFSVNLTAISYLGLTGLIINVMVGSLTFLFYKVMEPERKKGMFLIGIGQMVAYDGESALGIYVCHYALRKEVPLPILIGFAIESALIFTLLGLYIAGRILLSTMRKRVLGLIVSILWIPLTIFAVL